MATAFEIGWSDLSNGELLAAAEERFDALVTTDQQLRYQQNLANRKIAILVLSSASWPRLRPRAAEIATAVDALASGGYVEFP